MPKFKVGDIVVANSENYSITCKSNHYIGRVVEVNEEENTIDVETISHDMELPGVIRKDLFTDLDENDFDLKTFQ